MKIAGIQLLQDPKTIIDFKEHLIQFFLLVGVKSFPDEWDEYIIFLNNVLISNIKDITENLDLVSCVIEITFNLLKQLNSIKTPGSRMKFYKVKQNLLCTFKSFYEGLNSFYIQEVLHNSNELFILKYINLLKQTDKALFILVEISFSINDFSKDEILVEMLSLGIEKSTYLLNQITQIINSINSPKLIIKELKSKLFISFWLITKFEDSFSVL